MGMSKKFKYLSVSKGHYKASLGSTENSTFVARGNILMRLSNVRVSSRPRVVYYIVVRVLVVRVDIVEYE